MSDTRDIDHARLAELQVAYVESLIFGNSGRVRAYLDQAQRHKIRVLVFTTLAHGCLVI